MSVQYVSQDEIEEHEAAMQRVVEDASLFSYEKREQEEIEKERSTKGAGQKQMQIVHAEKNPKLAAMQRDFDRLNLLRQVYHESPNDVFELIVSKCSDWYTNGWGRGGLNAFRLANKRLKQVVESCTTRLTNYEEDGPDSLPIPAIQRCRRISCFGINSPHLSDLSPLAFCSEMEQIWICSSSITDISVVSSMPLLETFACFKGHGKPSIKDLSPLSSCPVLKKLNLHGNRELKDLSPLSACTALEFLNISGCPLITSLAPLSACTALDTLDISFCSLITSLAPLSSCTALQTLNITCCRLIKSLAPLSTQVYLTELRCRDIDPQTSFWPLASCIGLKELCCCHKAVCLEELILRRPDIFYSHLGL